MSESSDYLNEQIGYNVQGTAEWRRGKAEQFPDDARNLQAAEELECIAQRDCSVRWLSNPRGDRRGA